MSAVLPVQASNVLTVTSGQARAGQARADAAGSATFEVSLSRDASPSHAPSDNKTADSPYSKFEAMVVSQLVSTMLSSSGESMFGEDGKMDAFSSVFAGAIGDEVVRNGGIGLAEMLARTRGGSQGG